MEIKGLDKVENKLVFHAGTKFENNKFFTFGGRVLNVVGIDKSLERAIKKAYEVGSLINFNQKYFRTDIGNKAFKYFKEEEQ